MPKVQKSTMFYFRVNFKIRFLQQKRALISQDPLFGYSISLLHSILWKW